MADPVIGVDPATGRLTLDGQVLDRNDPRMYGSLGRNVTDISTGDSAAMVESGRSGEYDPNFYEQYTEWTDNGPQTRYRLKPEAQQALGGQIQLGQSGVGGNAETIDPSKLHWSDQYGILTDPSNIHAPDKGNLLAQYPWLLALPAVAGIAAGAMGGAGATGATGAAEGATGAAGAAGDFGAEGFTGLGGAGGSGLAGGVPGYGAAGAAAGGTPWGLDGPYAPGQRLAGAADNWLINNGLEGVAASGLTNALTLPGVRHLLGGALQAGGVPGASGSPGGGAHAIGNHGVDLDPFGLLASGLGPWSGMTKDAKSQVTQALLNQHQPTNPWG